MNVLQIKIHEDGTLECSPDFKIIRGSYRNILMNVEVPHSLLLDPVSENTDNGQIVDRNVNGNNLQVGAIIRTVTGKNLQTIRYGFQMVKDYIQNGIWYRLYQRIMPKEFTLWETVNQCEEAGNGYLDLVFNVVNWTKEETNVKIETVTASPILRLQVLASTFLNNVEDIDNPSQLDQLQSQTNELSSRVDFIRTDMDLVKTQITSLDARTETLENEVVEIQNNISSLQNETHEIEDNVYALHNKTQELETDLQNKTSELKTDLQNSSQELKNDISNLWGEVNSKATFCGWFNNLADLKKAYPVATENDFAYIIKNNIYVWKSGSWTNSGIDTPISVTPIVQTVGELTDAVMSQKAVTDAINAISVTPIVQTVGELTDAVMSQKAVTDAINAIPLGRTIAKTMDEWEMENPILEVGQFGYDSTNKITKIGDGVQTWDKLDVFLVKHNLFFANASWEEINELANKNIAQFYFSVGDTRLIKLSTNSTIQLVILGFNHDDLSSENKKAGITIGVLEIDGTTYKMNSTATNLNGWNKSLMRTETIIKYFNWLPEDLQKVIKKVNKKTTKGNRNTEIEITQDDLFLLSLAEIGSNISLNNTLDIQQYANYYSNEGQQYEYFKIMFGDANITSRRELNRYRYQAYGSTDVKWWLRSPDLSRVDNFWEVQTMGNGVYSNNANTSAACLFAFCI